MGLESWHPGKLVVLWVGIFFVELLLFGLVELAFDENLFILEVLFGILFFVVPFFGLLITWRWFGTREGR